MNAPSVLIVEDEYVIAKDIMMSLENMGYTVCSAVSSGEEAIAKAKKEKPDIILMDIVLRGDIDGIDAASQIRSLLRIPIIYLTSFADEELVGRAKITEPFGYIIKPFKERELNTAIEVALFKNESEKKIKESEEKYRKLVHDSIDGIVIVKGTEIKFVNASLLKMFGFENEAEMTCRPMTDFISPEYRDLMVKRDLPREMEQEEPSRYEFVALRKDGTEFFAELSVSRITYQRKIARQGIIRDITERKHAEEERLKVLSEINSIMETIPDIIYMVDLEGKLINWNEAVENKTKYTKNELKDKVTLELVHPDDRESARDAITEVYRKGYADRELRLLTKENKSIPHFFSGKVKIDNNGEVIGIVGTAKDITDLKQLEDQLRQSQKMEAVGTLAGGIAHDFNNILGIMIGNTELALDDVPEWNPARSNLVDIKAAGLRAKEVVRQLLSFSQKSGQKKRSLNITPLINESMQLLRASIPSTIEIRANISDDSSKVEADPTEIQQVLINLCTNAAHAMEQSGGILEVSLNQIDLDAKSLDRHSEVAPGPYVQLTVRDTGQGIDREIQDKIFDPYFTTKEVGKGSGMGLAIVHGIVMDHDGAITFHSQPERGTTIEILFPICEEEYIEKDADTDDLPTGDERILFIDDEESIVKMTKQILERFGYQVETRKSPVEALDLFRSNPEDFDLVITDMTMPLMTGVTLSEKLKAVRSDIPVIICTGYNSQITPKKALGFGIAAFVMKPIARKDIARTIRKVLDEPRG